MLKIFGVEGDELKAYTHGANRLKRVNGADTVRAEADRADNVRADFTNRSRHRRSKADG